MAQQDQGARLENIYLGDGVTLRARMYPRAVVVQIDRERGNTKRLEVYVDQREVFEGVPDDPAPI